MYRIAFIVIVILAIALGLVVGTLNSEITHVDMLWVQLDWPLGLILLCAAAAGLFLGLLLTWLFSVLPLKARLRRSGQAHDKRARFENLNNGNG